MAGLVARRIARELGVDRETVARYARAEPPGGPKPAISTAGRPSRCECCPFPSIRTVVSRKANGHFHVSERSRRSAATLDDGTVETVRLWPQGSDPGAQNGVSMSASVARRENHHQFARTKEEARAGAAPPP